MLLALLVVMHVNFVAQPGCSKEFSGLATGDAQLVQVKITGSRNHITDDSLISQVKQVDIAKDSGVWELSDNTHQLVSLEENSEENLTPEISARQLAGAGRGFLGTNMLHYLARWNSEAAVCVKSIEQTLRSFWKVWRITGWEPFTTSPKGDRRSVAWSRLDSVLGLHLLHELAQKLCCSSQNVLMIGTIDLCGDFIQLLPCVSMVLASLTPKKPWSRQSVLDMDLPDKGKVLDPTYLYSLEKGYLMLSDRAKSQHGVRSVNVTISAQNSCFGNRWQQLLIDNFVGYDTILMNSLLHARGKGYLYNFQTKELYNLNYLQEFGGVPHGFEDYIVFKCGVLITSLFVFFTTTMSVSFTLRETQARMLKFTVQLQHHARHRLPTYRLIFVHVVESLVFVPFFDDQLLAFMVLTLVWLCELYTMISVRTPLSMQYFPCFFFLYFMVFHIYFFSYTYGFSYLAFSATGAFMQHLVLYFWNQFEVPALQNFLHRRALFQQQRLQISSAIFRVAGLRSSSLLGDTQGTALNSMSERGGNFLNMHMEIGGQYGNGPERALLERNGTSDHRNLQASVHPFSIRNLSSFPVDGTADVYNASIGNQNTNFSSLGRSTQSGQHDELGSSVGFGGLSEDTENVSGRDRIRTIPGMIFQSSGSEAQVSAGEGTQAGPFTSIRSVLPWMLGSGNENVVSVLPIFQGLRNHRQLDMVLRTGPENNERGFSSGANNELEQESEERVLVRGVYSPARLRR